MKSEFDKFYTKFEIVDLCIKLIHFEKYKSIIEPSAGNGSFSNKIINCIAYDIKPENTSIIKQNFLTLKPDFKSPVLVIGNPPFGRQNSLALKFIKKSCIFCNTLAFILPKSFKKQSLQNKIPVYFHLIQQIDLPENSFILDNKDYDVPCIFQIWELKNYKRKIDKTIKSSKYFKFVKKNEFPDYSIRRVGFYAGKIDKDIDKNIQTHYFIKILDNQFLELYNKITFDFDNTVGPRSISKQEIYKKIENF